MNKKFIYYGERLISKSKENNIVFKKYEQKEFYYNFLELIYYIKNYITDDPLELEEAGIYIDLHGEFVNFKPNILVDWIEQQSEMNKSCGDTEEDVEWLTKWIKILNDCQDYLIDLTPTYIKPIEEYGGCPCFKNCCDNPNVVDGNKEYESVCLNCGSRCNCEE